MLRPRSLRPALAAAALALGATLAVPGVVPQAAPGAVAAPAVAPAADEEGTQDGIDDDTEDEAPLAVSITSLTPGAIPRRGPIRVSGEVTNRSAETWSTVKLYPFLGATPMTSAEQLAAAAELPHQEYVGDRIIEVGDTVDELAPGESAPFTIRLPRSRIPVTAAGVYWFGVHALGESVAGRDDVADGRARTFLPLVEPGTPGRVRTAVVIPLRRALTRESDGSLAGVEAWTRTLGSEGSLRSLVDLGASAGDQPVTWLIDPALVDAVRDLAAGNPPRSLAPTVPGAPAEDDDQGDREGGDNDSDDGSSGGSSGGPDVGFSPGAAVTDGDGGDAGQGRGAAGHEPDEAERAAAEVASAWLGRLAAAMEGDEVLTLPYGDLDVAGAVAVDPSLLDRTRARSAEATSSWAVGTDPAIASPTGYLDAATVRAASPGDTLLVTDRMFGPDAPGVAKAAGRRLVVTSSAVAEGGPGPDDPLSGLAVRQRLLSEAALRLLTPGRTPLVVQLPGGWRPGSISGFFDGLEEDWLVPGTVADAADRDGTAVDLADLAIPERQDARRVDAATFEAAAGLVRDGEVLQHVLRDNTSVAAEVADEALAAVSYSSRGRVSTARLAVLASRRWIAERLASVTIDAPRGVALSSANGRFAATVSNGLDEPVEVSIQAVTDDPAAISIEGPETVEIGAGQRASVLLDATTREPGVHKVRLVLTDHTATPDDDPTPIGDTEELSIRSIEASGIIWVIIGAGAVLLFGTIAVRLVRSVLRARREEASA